MKYVLLVRSSACAIVSNTIFEGKLRHKIDVQKQSTDGKTSMEKHRWKNIDGKTSMEKHWWKNIDEKTSMEKHRSKHIGNTEYRLKNVCNFAECTGFYKHRFLSTIRHHIRPPFAVSCTCCIYRSCISNVTPTFVRRRADVYVQFPDSCYGFRSCVYGFSWADRRAMFRVKSVQLAFTEYVWQIYVKNPPFDSLVWGSLRLAPIIMKNGNWTD